MPGILSGREDENGKSMGGRDLVGSNEWPILSRKRVKLVLSIYSLTSVSLADGTSGTPCRAAY